MVLWRGISYKRNDAAIIAERGSKQNIRHDVLAFIWFKALIAKCEQEL